MAQVRLSQPQGYHAGVDDSCAHIVGTFGTRPTRRVALCCGMQAASNRGMVSSVECCVGSEACRRVACGRATSSHEIMAGERGLEELDFSFGGAQTLARCGWETLD